MSFNTASDMNCMQLNADGSFSFEPLFQYRKRYELHAILFPGALGNSELKSRFSKAPSLFAIFPKPSGIFLSQNRLKRAFAASNIKETFVHEENLKLMAFFMIFCTSL